MNLYIVKGFMVQFFLLNLTPAARSADDCGPGEPPGGPADRLRGALAGRQVRAGRLHAQVHPGLGLGAADTHQAGMTLFSFVVSFTSVTWD